MRLKSLELLGYKTFASRTLFDFADSVTAIVGPNGSGKSNIADSLRWVLGEQSYALLRGKKTEDMIFSGSEHRPRAGMASASVVFDNSDGWLPIDFNEVAITRRAYRDGTNEYLINGQRVRLKDVSELLAQSGLAERTYTIIGQGLVDAALALKAEERRRLFEEAAGIGLHRARREEALRRLETTRRNLDRVQDILAELQPRLRSLERQARRAHEYEQIKADLRVLLREWYGYHWHTSQKELAISQQVARKQELALDKTRQNASAVGDNLAVLREQISGLRARLNSWHRQAAQLHNERETLSRQRAVTDERIRSLHEQVNNLRGEIAQLEEEAGLRQESFNAARQEVEHLESELKEARSQAEDARAALHQRLAEREAVERSLETSRQALSALNDRHGQLQARRAERSAQAERLQKAQEAASQAFETAQKELEMIQSRLQDAAGRLAALDAQRLKLDDSLLSYRQQSAEINADRQQALEEHSARAAEATRSKAQYDVLQGAEDALSGYASGAQVLLKAARQDRLKGARGALSSSLEVPADLEIAIAAALGEYLDAILLEGDTDPQAAMDLLEGQTARGSLLPMDRLQPLAPLSIQDGEDQGAEASLNGDGILGLAADLVKAPPELRPAVDLFLGQVLVARDRLSAQQALRRFGEQAPGARVVTLRGEVFHFNGPIQAGAQAKGALGRRASCVSWCNQWERFKKLSLSWKKKPAVLVRPLKRAGMKRSAWQTPCTRRSARWKARLKVSKGRSWLWRQPIARCAGRWNNAIA
jgi:chromosome segregation protein